MRSRYECTCPDCNSCVENGKCCSECEIGWGLEGPSIVKFDLEWDEVNQRSIFDEAEMLKGCVGPLGY